jgi:predicted alpha/beta hydrolase
MEKLFIKAADGYKLGAMYGRPVGTSIGTVVISSATAVKKEFYISYAQYLIQNGYNVLLFDYRGVGESAPDELKNCNAYMHEWGMLDMNAALHFLVYEKGLSDIIWVGHSIGAQLTGFLTSTASIKKVIAVNAAVGYWGYFPFPRKIAIWALWYVISPVLVKLYGYGTMKIVGWGENLPKNVLMEWRKWCMSKTYYADFLKTRFRTDKFYDFKVPLVAVYTSDDFIANDKTASLMLNFFPNAPTAIIKLEVGKYTRHKAGHVGIFRKKFKNDLWVVLTEIIEDDSLTHKHLAGIQSGYVKAQQADKLPA